MKLNINELKNKITNFILIVGNAGFILMYCKIYLENRFFSQLYILILITLISLIFYIFLGVGNKCKHY